MRRFARRYFADPRQAVGRYYGNGAPGDVKTDIQIIGVVKDAKAYRHTP